MARKILAAALLYSKKLSKFISWAWVLYRFSVLIASVILPSAAAAIVSTIQGLDVIMMINISTYMVNSLGEKIIYSDRFVLKWLDKGGFKYLLGRLASNFSGSSDDDEENDEGDNG